MINAKGFATLHTKDEGGQRPAPCTGNRERDGYEGDQRQISPPIEPAGVAASRVRKEPLEESMQTGPVAFGPARDRAEE